MEKDTISINPMGSNQDNSNMQLKKIASNWLVIIALFQKNWATLHVPVTTWNYPVYFRGKQ